MIIRIIYNHIDMRVTYYNHSNLSISSRAPLVTPSPSDKRCPASWSCASSSREAFKPRAWALLAVLPWNRTLTICKLECVYIYISYMYVCVYIYTNMYHHIVNICQEWRLEAPDQHIASVPQVVDL